MFVFISKSVMYLKYCECLKYCVVELGFTGLYSAESVSGIFVYIVFLLWSGEHSNNKALFKTNLQTKHYISVI